MTPTYDHLNDMHFDVLREIGNIGAGNAATSLSMLLEQPVDMSTPIVNLLKFSDVPAALGGSPETLTYSVLVSLGGDVEGLIMFLLNKEFAHLILNVLTDKHYESFTDLDDMSLSVLKEVGNILASAYINSLAELTGLTIMPSVPSASVDMAGAILSVPLIQFAAVGDHVLFIEEDFASQEDSVKSYMVLFTEIESLNLILRKLGLL